MPVRRPNPSGSSWYRSARNQTKHTRRGGRSGSCNGAGQPDGHYRYPWLGLPQTERPRTMTSRSDCLFRKPLRARGYDCSTAGLYFVTIYVHHMEPRFGKVDTSGVVLNDAGRSIQALWTGIPDRHMGVGLDAYVVMPNHLHGIVVLGTNPEAKPPSLGVIVGQFTSLSAAVYRDGARGDVRTVRLIAVATWIPRPHHQERSIPGGVASVRRPQSRQVAGAESP